MECVDCGSAAISERRERTAQGYRRFRCRDCGRQFNERSGGQLNRTQYPSDGHWQLNRKQNGLGLTAGRRSAFWGHLGARFLAPDPESLGACPVIADRRHEMPTWPEMAVDHAVRGQETL
jgi:hypothetical protein